MMENFFLAKYVFDRKAPLLVPGVGRLFLNASRFELEQRLAES